MPTYDKFGRLYHETTNDKHSYELRHNLEGYNWTKSPPPWNVCFVEGFVALENKQGDEFDKQHRGVESECWSSWSFAVPVLIMSVASLGPSVPPRGRDLPGPWWVRHFSDGCATLRHMMSIVCHGTQINTKFLQERCSFRVGKVRIPTSNMAARLLVVTSGRNPSCSS